MPAVRLSSLCHCVGYKMRIPAPLRQPGFLQKEADCSDFVKQEFRSLQNAKIVGVDFRRLT